MQKHFQQKGGFIDYEPLDKQESCNSQKHNPPGYIVLKPGKHTYKCPDCGKETIINVPEIKF
jgi:hypothetical protein